MDAERTLEDDLDTALMAVSDLRDEVRKALEQLDGLVVLNLNGNLDSNQKPTRACRAHNILTAGLEESIQRTSCIC